MSTPSEDRDRPAPRLPDCVDVVVVGARAAGAATAMLLAEAGLSVVVLDRDRPEADTLSTHALMRGGVLQLSRWGLLGSLTNAGTPPIREVTFHFTTSDLRLPVKPSPGVEALAAPRRTVLDPLLVDAARRAGACIAHRVEVVGLDRDHERVTGVFARPHGTDRHADLHRIRARLVIGADGRNSRVAEWVGAPVTHRAVHTSAFCYAYFSGLETSGYQWAYRPAGTAGFIPTNGGLTCVFAGHRPDVVGRGRADGLLALVRAASAHMGERLATARRESAVRTFPGRPGHLRVPWGSGWALVGDAGSWKDPISAHGLTDALRDAELLARAAVTAELDAGPRAYADYTATRDRLTLPILTLSDEVAAMNWDEERISTLLRELNSAMGEEVREIEGWQLQV